VAGTPTITHTFQSAKADGPDPSLLQPSHWNDEHVVTGPGFIPIGAILDYAGYSAPQYFLECYGQSVSAASYPDLKNALVKSGTATITIASPGVVTWSSHGRQNGDPVKFSTTGALPTGLTADTTYYIINKTANTFQLAATPGGTAINTSGSQSGTHTAIHAPHGCANDLSTFNVPDLRGRVTVGYDSMGGTSADRLTGLSGGVNGDVMGAAGGAQTHTLTSADVPAHTHAIDPPSTSTSSDGSHTHTNTFAVDSGGGHTHTHTLAVDSGGGHTHTHTLAVDSGGSHTHADTFTIDSGGSHSHSLTGSISHTLTVNSGGSHTHTHALAFSGTFSGATGGESAFVDYDIATNFSGGGSKNGVTSIGEGKAEHGSYAHQHPFSGSVSGSVTGTINSGGAHTHTLSGSISNTFAVASGGSHSHNISGSVSSGGAHTHTLSGSITSGGAHTHTLSGSITSAAAHTHTLSGSIASGGAHTHTVDIGSFTSGSYGSGGAHNNVQPSLVVRKIIFAGV
jgi:microcystin-dependent protein